MFLQVAAAVGLKMQVQTSPIMQLYISLPEFLQGHTKGLCGTFNDNANDDFLSAYNIVENAPLTFANSWATENNCPPSSTPDPCISSENENYAKQHCSLLKNPAGAFSVCHSTVDYMNYYQMCVAATCACENIDDCLCAALGAYVHECAANGVIVRNWRRDICNISCSKSQVYQDDMRACNRTCRSLSENDYSCKIKDVPVYGCGCSEQKYLDEHGFCVEQSNCLCYYEGRLIENGQNVMKNGTLCICQNGRLECRKKPDQAHPGCQSGKVMLNCTSVTASSSEDLCKKTCRTLSIPCKSSCVPGCACPNGLVEDDNGNCITPENCPCFYHGELHTTGKTIQEDCNKCTCQGGLWSCTNKICPRTCEVYGDGHYITFDGKRYVYDGNCEYIIVEDQCNRQEGTLQILTENVPCCERGMTCSRNTRILLEGKEIILTDNQVVTTEKFMNQTQCTMDSYSVHTVGLYLILSLSNGITVIWDKNTRLSITLDSRWKNKVCGLCGNFNDDVSDDMTTKGNSLVSNAVVFGNSWKSMTCSDTVNQTSPCERNPYCSAWSLRKCNIIKNNMFQSCHSKVDPTPYYEACVEEACACDLEGKYLGFCTAVAVYAEACNKAGVCVDWRTPDQCPVYCDYYNSPGECSWHYRPCGTLTARTCSDHEIRKKFSAVLEGCYAQCPEASPYLDENTMKCVKLSDCTCYYNGEILEPGEERNNCKNCTCIEGKMNCTDFPTTTTEVSTSTSTPTTTTEVSTSTSTPTTTTELSTSTSTPTTTTELSTSTSTPTTTTEVSTSTSTPTTTELSTSTSTPSTTTEVSTSTSTPTTTTEVSTSTSTPTTTTEVSTSTEGCSLWSKWYNENTPSLQMRSDTELLNQMPKPLCTNSNITDIQCEAVKFPQLPISEMKDNVTCDKEMGLVCTYNPETSKDLMCLDYRIRVCCGPYTPRPNSTASTTVMTTNNTVPTIPSTTSLQTIEPSSVTLIPTTITTTLLSTQATSTVATSILTTVNNTLPTTLSTSAPQTCVADSKPSCQKSSIILNENGCEKWDCYCECLIWGDPHYLTFGGTQYNFFENCTYTLVEERLPKYNFSILVDNYFCFPGIDLSCARGLIILYNASSVIIQTNDKRRITFDDKIVTAPYSSNGINIQSENERIYITIPDILVNIMSSGSTFQVRLSQKYFLNNTQGQCGSCLDNAVDECRRRNGKIMPTDCCHITANDWKVSDPNKPYCESAPMDLPCTPPPAPPPPCKPKVTLCNILLEKPFEKCRNLIPQEVYQYYNSCLFDQCNTNTAKIACSSIQACALACGSTGICVDWRTLTNGFCKYSCPSWMVYEPCASQDNNDFENNKLTRNLKLSPLSEGCVCPKGMILSENRTACIKSSCTDSSGNKRYEGEIWRDSPDECIFHKCIKSQTRTISDRARCCSSCLLKEDACQLLVYSKSVTQAKSGCSAEIQLAKCQGSCPGRVELDTDTKSMINECSCCRATRTENKTVNLDCGNGVSMPYNYTYIAACKCSSNNCDKNTLA